LPRQHGSAAAPPDALRPANHDPLELIAAAFSLAQGLSKSPSLSEAQVRELLNQVEGARRAFSAGGGQYASPESVLLELEAALQNVRATLAGVKAGGGSDETARLRLEWAATRLRRAKDRVRRRWGFMLFLVVLFVGLIIFLAFYLNWLLDKREERRLKRDSGKPREPLWSTGRVDSPQHLPMRERASTAGQNLTPQLDSAPATFIWMVEKSGAWQTTPRHV
jgi:hypothetical protein